MSSKSPEASPAWI